jgi:hypothetical protein
VVKRGANFGTSAQKEVAAWQTVYLNTNGLLKKYAPGECDTSVASVVEEVSGLHV